MIAIIGEHHVVGPHVKVGEGAGQALHQVQQPGPVLVKPHRSRPQLGGEAVGHERLTPRLVGIKQVQLVSRSAPM